MNLREPHDEGPGEHDAHLQDDDREETVPCARCGQAIWAYSQQCPKCGIHFQGEAWEYKPAGGQTQPLTGRAKLMRLTAIVVLFAMLLVWVFRGVPLF